MSLVSISRRPSGPVVSPSPSIQTGCCQQPSEETADDKLNGDCSQKNAYETCSNHDRGDETDLSTNSASYYTIKGAAVFLNSSAHRPKTPITKHGKILFISRDFFFCILICCKNTGKKTLCSVC